MKQICYLSGEGEKSRFDALFGELDAVSSHYDVSKVASLVAFVQREKTLPEQDFLLLDLSKAAWSTSHVLSAVQYLRRFCRAELIVLAEPGEETTQLFGGLGATFHVRCLVELKEDEQAVLQKVRACLLGEMSPLSFVEDMVKRAAAETTQVARPVSIPPGLVIQVGVAGSGPRCGVTTQLFALYQLLRVAGFRPAILDREGTYLRTLWDFYASAPGTQEYEDHVTISGVSFCVEAWEGADAYLVDYGILAPETVGDFAANDLSVLVCGTKPWELPATIPGLKLAQQATPRSLTVLATSTTAQTAQELEPVLGPLVAAPYRPDPWEGEVGGTYRDTFLPLLRRICGDSR